MDFSLFTEHGSKHVPLADIEKSLDELKREGHINNQQFTYLTGEARGMARHGDNTIDGDAMHRWMYKLKDDHNDFGISSDKVDSHIAPAFASHFQPPTTH